MVDVGHDLVKFWEGLTFALSMSQMANVMPDREV
jgi:hypothetical protein